MDVMNDGQRKRIKGSFRDLEVYQMARVGSRLVFKASKQFPKEEKFALTDQIRRSSRAVGAMIAEAWARRRYEAAFVNKLNEAQGEAMETQSWLDESIDDGYITEDTYREIDSHFQQLGGKLERMIEKSSTFAR